MRAHQSRLLSASEVLGSEMVFPDKPVLYVATMLLELRLRQVREGVGTFSKSVVNDNLSRERSQYSLHLHQ